MKWYEYFFIRTFMKAMDELKNIRRKSEINKIKEQEICLEKGYWRYNEKIDDYDFIEPKKNQHFVTSKINYDEEIYQVVISKKPKSLESEPFDNPWDAESFCSSILDIYRKSGFTTEVKREAPVVIVDSDICCPFCFNSSSLREWFINSYKQELSEVPKKFDSSTDSSVRLNNLTTEDIQTKRCWCPICNNGVDDRNLMITKGFEWKVNVLHEANLNHHLSPYMKELYRKKEEKAILKSKEAALLKRKKEPLNEPREVIQDPLGNISSDCYQGLVVRGTETIKTRKELIQVPKWLSIQNQLPKNFELNSTPYTSYKVNAKQNWIPKRAKNEYPIIYLPVHEISLPYYNERDEEKISQVKAMFHAGELIEPIRISVRKEAYIYSYHLAIFAFEMGLTHVPILVSGERGAKQALESQYKEKVKKIRRE